MAAIQISFEMLFFSISVWLNMRKASLSYPITPFLMQSTKLIIFVSAFQWSEFCSWSSLLVSFLHVPATVHLSYIFSILIKYLWTGTRDWVCSFICNVRNLQGWELSCANKLFLEDTRFWDYGFVIFHIIPSMRWRHSGITCSQWFLSLLQAHLYHEIFGKKILGLDCSELHF